MPHKVNYENDDYDVGYHDYEEYGDHDYDYDVEENGEAPIPALESKQETAKPRVWSCAICTYDNDEGMFVCDICGVLRTPLVNASINNNNKTVGGICEDSGASIMAKSLFASLPLRIPEKAVVVQLQNDGSMIEEGNNFLKLGNIQGKFHEFHEAFSSKAIPNLI